MTQQMTRDRWEAAILPTEQLFFVEERKIASRMAGGIMKAHIWQFLRFCIVGTSNAIIDFGVLNLLLWLYPTTDTLRTLGYNSIAVLLAATNSFFWNKYWTFQKSTAITIQEVYRFIVVASGTMFMNDLLMWLLGEIFPGIMRSSLLGANALKLGAIIGTMSISFFGMRLWVFFQGKFEGDALFLSDYETVKLPSSKLALEAHAISTRTIRPTHKINTIAFHNAFKLSSDMTSIKTSNGKSWRNYPMKTLIIIPTYNESDNLLLLLSEVFTYAPQTDVLVVDDNSPDGTGELAEEIRKQNSHVHVLHRPGRLGLGTAYIAGFKFAIQHDYDAAFEMDADFSHDPRYLPDFLEAIKCADLVIGSRYIPGGSTPNWSITRRLISGSGNVFARFMLGIPIHDCTGGFRCYRTHVLQNIDLDSIKSRGYAFQVELTYRVLKQGYKIFETPITFMDRRFGKSKMSRKIVIEAFTYVLRTRFSKQTFTLKTGAPLESANAVSFSISNFPQQDNHTQDRNISNVQLMEQTYVPKIHIQKSQLPRYMRSIKLEHLE